MTEVEWLRLLLTSTLRERVVLYLAQATPCFAQPDGTYRVRAKVQDIAEGVFYDRCTVSRHLPQLRAAGLCRADERGWITITNALLVEAARLRGDAA